MMSEKITLPGLVARLSERTGDTRRESEDFIKQLFAVIAAKLEEGESVRVRGLGVFKTIEVEQRKSVNVNTGQENLIAAHRKVVFVPSKEMAALVNEPFSMFRTIELEDDEIDDIDEGVTEPDVSVTATERVPETIEEDSPEAITEDAPEAIVEDSSDAFGTLYQINEEEERSLTSETVDNDAEKDADDDADSAQQEPETPAGNESHNSDDEKVESVCEEDAENIEVNAPVKKRAKRYWRGFVAGFVTAFLLAAVTVAIIFMVKPASGNADADKQIAEVAALPEPATQPDSVINDSKIVAQPSQSEESAGQKETVEQTADDAVPTQPSDKKTYDVISKTRYLTTMAKDHYGNYHLWPYIYKENEKILGHPDHIRPGTKVVVPPLSKYGVNPNDAGDIAKAKKMGVEIYARYKK